MCSVSHNDRVGVAKGARQKGKEIGEALVGKKRHAKYEKALAVYEQRMEDVTHAREHPVLFLFALLVAVALVWLMGLWFIQLAVWRTTSPKRKLSNATALIRPMAGSKESIWKGA